MQYLHHLLPFVDVNFLVDQDLNFPWAKEDSRWACKVVGCSATFSATWQRTMTCLCNQVGLVIHPLNPKVCANKTMFIWTRGFWATPWLISAKMKKKKLINQSTRPFLNGTTFKLATGPTPKCHFPIPRTLATLGPIILCANFRLKSSLKQSCSLCQERFNGMSHATYTQGNQGDFRLLVVKSQIANFTISLFFCHNLCVKCSNGSYEPILDIYVPRAFQWYKELFNPIGWPLRSLSEGSRVHRDSNSQSGSSLGSMRVHSFTFSYTPESMRCDFWASFLACTLTNPYFSCKPKFKVTTHSANVC